jgi:hypothetical protein
MEGLRLLCFPWNITKLRKLRIYLSSITNLRLPELESDLG